MWHSPFQTHASGRNEIVDEWMSERDAFVGEMFDANYEPVSIDGQTVEAYGRTFTPTRQREKSKRPTTTCKFWVRR